MQNFVLSALKFAVLKVGRFYGVRLYAVRFSRTLKKKH